MKQLPWRFISVPADGKCALHATAVACGHKDAASGNNVCNRIKSDLLNFYAGTQAATMINDLFTTGNFMNDTNITDFGDSNIANPLYFKDFICAKSPWVKNVVAFKLECKEEIGISRRCTCNHSKILSFVHRTAGHNKTTQAILKRCAVIFLNYSNHWYVLIPYEKSIGL